MFKRNFVFGEDSVTANVIGVDSTELYYPGKGYGFVVEQNRKEQELLQIPELNSGFDIIYWLQDENITFIKEDKNGCFVDSDAAIAALEQKNGETMQGEHRRIPLLFKIDVPRQGNYKLDMIIKSEEELEEVLIFTGRRRLIYRGKVSAHSELRCSAIVNVCDIIPRGKERVYADKTLDITVVASKPRITALSITSVNCPTIYIGGDSTVTDQHADYPYAPSTSYCGWGQMFTAFLNNKLAVSNHSHSGLTSESFRKEGHYAVVNQYCKPGDFIFFQFAHNDQKFKELAAKGGYQDNLIKYVTECRDKGLYPLLVTPIVRNTWKGNDGTYNDLLVEYADACLSVGEKMNVPVLDLHKESMKFVLQKGLDGSKRYFYPYDFTHTNDYGAYIMAGFIAAEIKRVCSMHSDLAYRLLAECVITEREKWTPPEKVVPLIKPKIYENKIYANEAAPLLAEIECLDEVATRVAALDMVIRTCRFVPTNVYNDMYSDIAGHEWYAGVVECACQNDIIDEGLVKDNCFYPLQEITLEEFLVLAMGGYRSRKKLPVEQPCIYDEKCQEYAKPFVRASCQLGIIPNDGSSVLQVVISRGEAVQMCRKMREAML